MSRVTEALETFKKTRKAKHDADMAHLYASQELVAALADEGVKLAELELKG